jgi:hypothetical protein
MAKFNVGDRVEVESYLYVGKATVVEVKPYEQMGLVGYILETDGENGSGRPDGNMFEYEEKLTLLPKFKSGDKVIGKKTGSTYVLSNRKPHRDEDGRGIAWGVEGQAFGWLGEDQIELVEEKAKGDEEMAKFNLGDKLEIVGNKRDHRFSTGDVVTVIEVDEGDKQPYLCKGSSGYNWWVTESDVKAAVNKPEFKAGDRARIIGTGLRNDGKTICHYHEVGSIGEVTSVGTGSKGKYADVFVKGLPQSISFEDLEAVEEIEIEITLDDVIDFLRSKDDTELLDIVEQSRKRPVTTEEKDVFF